MDIEEIIEKYENDELDFNSKNELNNTYNIICNRIEELNKEFEEKTKDDKNLQKYFENDNPANRYTDSSFASAVLAGIDLRNVQRENGNLSGEIEKYPYSEEQKNILDEIITLDDIKGDMEFYIDIGAYIFEPDEDEWER